MAAAAPTAEPAPTLDRLEGLAALHAAAEDWRALWRASPDAGPFAAPAWLLPWAEAYAGERALALAWREAGGLVGFAPFFTWCGRLHLAGAGPSDYGEVLAGRIDPDSLLAETCALAEAHGCEAVELPQLRPGSPLLSARAPRGWGDGIVPGDVCPVAVVPAGDPLGAMQPAWRRKLDYARRRLGRDRAHRYSVANPETLAHDAAVLRRLHAARWAERGEPGVLDEPLMRAFLERALPALARDGLLRLHRLDIDGEAAAAILALRAHGGVFVYITGFDPRFGRYSPGALLWAEVIERAAAEGAREIHFLRGREAYKPRWGAEDRPTWRRVLTRP